MKGCICELRHVVFAEAEELPETLVAGHPHHLKYMPVSLVLQAEDVARTLPAAELPQSIPKQDDRYGLFQLRPTYDYLQTHVGNEWISVQGTTFVFVPADAMIVYAAQGSTCNAVIVNMQRPPSIDEA